jgi:hypothetical protein
MIKGKTISRTEVCCDTLLQQQSTVSQPINLQIQSIQENFLRSKVGRHTRKTKNRTYTNPRLYLPSNLNHYIGTHYRLYKAKGTITTTLYELKDKDILILVLLPT